MIFTARQLEELHRASGSNGHLTLPYRARLTPLASDWVKAKKLALGYSDDGFARPAAGNGSASAAAANGTGCGTHACPTTPAAATPLAASQTQPPQSPSPTIAPPTGAILWWCDGPCGPAKGAVVGMEKEAPLRAMQMPQDRKWVIAVVKEIAGEIKAGRAAAGVILVQSAAATMVYANRCPSLRAVVGTCLEAVDQGLREVAANVLVIEHPYKTLPQVKSLLSKFVKARRELSDEVRRQLQDLAACS